MEDPIKWALFRLARWFGRCPSISSTCHRELCQGNGVAMAEAMNICLRRGVIRTDDRGIIWVEDLVALVRLAHAWPEIGPQQPPVAKATAKRESKTELTKQRVAKLKAEGKTLSQIRGIMAREGDKRSVEAWQQFCYRQGLTKRNET